VQVNLQGNRPRSSPEWTARGYSPDLCPTASQRRQPDLVG
jgi:hypothetical protein